ncbi:HxlR family transcriptional regulator [Pedobacter psychrotolerans]|uniref:HxlR family transcriptional regulator n=1 Tax=Pedobacter psychrotolerans TaxID=1843235 RepID=A0A4V6NN57_9SPHI|nr:helix-turn-helix domain-containing protein [Pedobacter psychrotolerans]TCO31186.1 HxlR family transcriptional regulator [Pedobacter psychrotolerans]GGE41628.1 HxlR family transcriptional regulator [Pedobacter psychrotolerans]
MSLIKQSSTIQQNKKIALNLCPVTYTLEKIGGYWKPFIIYHLVEGVKRYGELKRAIPAITEKVLIQHLKQMESDGLIIREAKAVVPPFVTYRLSVAGLKILPVIQAMAQWATDDMEQSTSDHLAAD